MMRIKKIIWYITAGLGLALLVLTGVQYGNRQRLQREIADKILRFHVLANSDSGEDQQLKLAVRDAVGAEMAKRLGGIDTKEECRAAVAEALPDITRTAAEVIAKEGYDYPVEAAIAQVDFPVKTYGAYTFPAGKYDALEVVIGAGGGHNWWCVMYPNMCFSGSVYEVVEDSAEESLREVLSPEEYQEVLKDGDYQVQFKYLTFLNGLCGGNEE